MKERIPWLPFSDRYLRAMSILENLTTYLDYKPNCTVVLRLESRTGLGPMARYAEGSSVELRPTLQDGTASP